MTIKSCIWKFNTLFVPLKMKYFSFLNCSDKNDTIPKIKNSTISIFFFFILISFHLIHKIALCKITCWKTKYFIFSGIVIVQLTLYFYCEWIKAPTSVLFIYECSMKSHVLRGQKYKHIISIKTKSNFIFYNTSKRNCDTILKLLINSDTLSETLYQ